MGKLARGLAVEFEHLFHAECAQHLRNGNAARRIDCIHGHLKVGHGNHILVDQRQLANHVDMLVHPAVNLLIATDFLNRGKIEIVLGGHVKQPCAFGGRDELTLFVEKFQSIPLSRVMAGCQNDASVSFQTCDGDFRSRRSAQTDVKHISAHGLQGAANHLVHKEARKTSVASDNDSRTFDATVLDKFDKSCGEFHHIYWRKVVARLAADGTTNAGNGFNQCHIYSVFNY